MLLRAVEGLTVETFIEHYVKTLQQLFANEPNLSLVMLPHDDRYEIHDVFLTNKDATLEILGRFTEELFALQRAIRTDNGPYLHDYFTRTRAIRRGIIEAGQDTDAPDFGRKSSAP